MRSFLNEKIKEIKPSGIRRFFDIASKIEGVISLGVGEPDFDTPWHISEEGIYSVERGNTFYTANAGLPELRKEICAFLKRKYDLNYQVDETLVTVGGSEAIDLALRACICNGDEVIIAKPAYVSYEPCAIMAGAKVVDYILEEADDFKIIASKFEKLITPKTKILIMNFPNNPTGAIMDKNSLNSLADVCIKHDILVISDEIYSELTYDDRHHTIASVTKMKDRTIIINGFSKAYSMTGWRLGYAVGPKEIIEQMIKIHQFTIMCAQTSSQYAGIEALRNGDNDIVLMREEYNQRRRFVLHRFNEMGIKCYVPKGAFYLFPNISKYDLSSEEFALKLLESEKVVVVPGTAFGSCGEGFIRISYAYSLDDLKKALNKLENFINSLSKVD